MICSSVNLLLRIGPPFVTSNAEDSHLRWYSFRGARQTVMRFQHCFPQIILHTARSSGLLTPGTQERFSRECQIRP
ncbi:MAG: hypothetical protein ACRD2L_16775, partial [Terriglobia bacterium]